jgi:3-oxoacyl-[acyl-carrier-protein] synthase II
LAEGAAVLVLEEHDHAVSRGANVLAEVVGVGYSGDGFHITAPEPMGEGAARAMRNAMNDAAWHGEESSHGLQVDYVNAHATSTPVGDVAEIRAIRLALSQCESWNGRPLLVSSTKGATGHLLGAAGAIEAAITVLAVSNQVVPHTRNLHEISDDIVQAMTDERCNVGDSTQSTGSKRDIRLVQHEPVYDELNLAMSNSFGFGGTNVSLLFAKYNT